MKSKGKIIIAGAFKLPENNAGATRALNIGRTLVSGGYDVELLGMGTKTVGILDGMKVQVLFNSGQSYLEKITGFALFSSRIIKAINDIHSSEPVKAIIIEGPSAWITIPLIRFAKTNKIKIIIDVVEWYQITHFKGGFFNIQAINHLIGFYTSYPKADGIIAISSLIEKRFNSNGCHTLYMPVTFDTSQFSPQNKTPNQKLVIAYAGMPGKKDHLAEAIRGLMLTPGAKDFFQFRLIGITKQHLLKMLKSGGVPFVEVEENIDIIGKVPISEARRLVTSADFTLLLRPNERYANAGFPTKFVESITLCTPVILNLTSDLKRFVTDGENSIVVDSCTAEAFSQGLKRIMAMQSQDIQTLSLGARTLAENEFDYHNYTASMAQFIEE